VISIGATDLPYPANVMFSMALWQTFVEALNSPMTLKTSKAEELANYADQQGQILMVGHLLLYQSAIAWMREYLATGKAGKVFHKVQSHLCA